MPAVASPLASPPAFHSSPGWTSEVVFKIQHGAQWEEMVKVASQNFDWKSHFVLGGDDTIFPFADEHGKLHGTPVEKNFPLHIVHGRCDLPGIQIVLADSGRVEFFSLPDRLPESQCVSPTIQTPVEPEEDVGNSESQKNIEALPEDPPKQPPVPPANLASGEPKRNPAMEEPPRDDLKKRGRGDETAAATSMYEDGSYWKTLVCIELMIDCCFECPLLYIETCFLISPKVLWLSFPTVFLPKHSSKKPRVHPLLPHPRWLRMKRYMNQFEKGKVQATPEVVKLWGTSGGRF